MNNKYYLVIGGLLLLIGITTVNQCGSPEPKPSDVEVPPSFSGLVDKAPYVRFCELVENPQGYSNQILRTEATLYSNHENVALSSSECNDTKNIVWTDFDPSYDYSDEAVKKKFTEQLCPQTPCPSGKAKVIVVGQFEGPNDQGYGHLNAYRYRFLIMRIIRADAAS